MKWGRSAWRSGIGSGSVCIGTERFVFFSYPISIYTLTYGFIVIIIVNFTKGRRKFRLGNICSNLRFNRRSSTTTMSIIFDLLHRHYPFPRSRMKGFNFNVNVDIIIVIVTVIFFGGVRSWALSLTVTAAATGVVLSLFVLIAAGAVVGAEG